MRLLHLDTERTWRGGEQQLLYLVRGLRERGHEQMVAAVPDSPLAEKLTAEGIPVLPVNPRYSFDLKTVRILTGIMKTWDPHLLHAHTGHTHLLGLLAVRKVPRPLVISRRVDFPRRRGPLSRWKFLSPRVSRYLAVSGAIAHILERDGVAPEKIRIIYDGVDTEKFRNCGRGAWRRRWNLPPDCFLLGNVAALAPHKDQATLIRAMRLVTLAVPRARLVIVGEGDQRPSLERLIRLLKLQDKVILTGFVSQVGEVLKNLDLFVMSSRTEGLGTSILDAMALEIPVVSTSAGGIPEIITHGSHGLLAPPENPRALGEAILQMINNPRSRAFFARRGRERALDFSWEKMAAATEKAYLELLNGD